MLREGPEGAGADPLVTVQAGVPASPPATRTLVDWVAAGLETAGWPRGDRVDVVLAVDEAVQNAVEHGSEPEAPVSVELSATGECAEVRVRDHGRAGAGTPSGPPATPDEHSIRGRGRIIMAALADDARWRPHGSGTEVELRFSRRAAVERRVEDGDDEAAAPAPRDGSPVA